MKLNSASPSLPLQRRGKPGRNNSDSPALRVASPLLGETQRGKAVPVFRLLSFLIFNSTFLITAPAQTWITNSGAKIFVGSNAAVNVQGNILHDTASVIHNYGTVRTDVTKTYGTIELKGDSSQWEIDSVLLLEEGKFFLNSNTLVIYNGDTGAIQADEGKLVSPESLLGKVKWHIGEDSGIYRIPFVNDLLDDAGIEFNVINAGTGSTGFLEFSSFGTEPNDTPNNQPHLPELLYFQEAAATIDTNWRKIADRLWMTKATGYTEKPITGITLNYASHDIQGANTINMNNISLSMLKNRCWQEVGGIADTIDRLFTIDTTDDYYIWMLHDTIVQVACNSGLSCEDAIWIEDHSLNGPFFTGDSIMWFRIIASDTNLSMHFCKYLQHTFQLAEILIYDSCLQLLPSKTAYHFGPCLSMYYPTTENSIYYIAAKQNFNSNSLFEIFSYDGMPPFWECATTDGNYDSIHRHLNRCPAYDPDNPILGETDRFIPDENTPLITLGVNLVIISRNDGSGNFDENVNDEGAYLDALTHESDWPSVNWRYANLSDNQDIQQLCYDGFIQDSRIRFQFNRIYHQDTTINNTQWTTGDLCPGMANWYLVGLHNQVNNDYPPGINIFLTNQQAPYDSVTNNNPLPNGTVSAQCSVFPGDDLDVFPHRIHAPNAYVFFRNAQNVAQQEGFQFDPIAPAENLSWGLSHELGHNLLGFLTMGNSSGCLIPPAGSTSEHRNYCIDNMMNNAWNDCDGERNNRNYFLLDDLGQAHNYLCTRDIRNYIAGCPYNPDNEFIVGNDLIDFDFRWHGNIRIPRGATLTVTCILRMPDDAKIIVERGGKLIVDGGTITSACNGLWAGIEVWGNAERDSNGNLVEPRPCMCRLYDFDFCEPCDCCPDNCLTPCPDQCDCAIPTYPSGHSYNHGAVVLVDATIENAHHAIRTVKTDEGGDDLRYAGGIVVAVNCTLRNNRFSVEIPRFNYRPIDGDARYYFRDCLFATDGELNGGALPANFVTLWNVRGVEFYNNTFINQTPEDYDVGQRGNGIVCYDAGFIVDNEENCTAYDEEMCVTWSANGFENLATAISIKSSYLAGSDPTVRYTNFVNNYFGILVQGTLFYKIYRNEFTVGNELDDALSSVFTPAGMFNIGSMFRLDENTFILPDNVPSRAVYTLQSGNWPALIYRNRVEGGGDDRSYGFAFSFDNSNLVNECNTVTDPMDHFLVFQNGSIFPRQGDCGNGRPAGNIFNSSCNNTTTLHFYVGSNVPRFEYCYNPNEDGFNPTCVIENSPFRKRTTTGTSQCSSNIVEVPGGEGSNDFYGKRAEQQGLSGLIADQYALLDDGRTEEILSLVHNESYSENQLRDTLLNYTPYLSDDVLVALLFRSNKSSNWVSHVLIENAPHSNLIWKAIEEANPGFSNDSMNKLLQYQDSTSSRIQIMDSLNVYKLEKGINYIDMLYYASIDTNYSIEEVKDSLEAEKDIPLRILLGDLYIADGEFTASENITDSLKTYFREDKELIDLRKIQLAIFGDTLTYFDLDSNDIGTMEVIAFNDTSVAAIQSKLILELINDTIYPYPYQDKEESSPKRSNEDWIQHNEDSLSAFPSGSYKLIPTIIQGEMYGLITLGNEERGELILYSIYGKESGRFTLSEGANKIPLNALKLTSGIYLYKVWANGEIKNKDKIVKVN